MASSTDPAARACAIVTSAGNGSVSTTASRAAARASARVIAATTNSGWPG
ncbi:MAG: hypothetical protein WDN24_08845 [Sphingomonas sp.]